MVDVKKSLKVAHDKDVLNVFVDVGHHSIKCMRVDNSDLTEPAPHLEFPTWLLPEIQPKLELIAKMKKDDGLKFINKEKMDEAIKDILQSAEPKSVTQRPIVAGMIQDIDSFVTALHIVGQIFVSMSTKLSWQEIFGFGYPDTKTRLIMTEPSMTIAGGDPKRIEQSKIYRGKLLEKVFENLRVHSVCFVSPQLPMLLSEMVLDGLVVDVGHEVTQIVPFIDGRASYHKAVVFPVAGMFVDYVLAYGLVGKKGKDLESDLAFNFKLSQRKAENFTRKKDDIIGINYELQDGTKLAKKVMLQEERNTALLDGVESFFD